MLSKLLPANEHVIERVVRIALGLGVLSLCRAVLALLGDYVDGELVALERGRVEEHLRGCTVCERFGGRYAGVVHAARDRLGATHAVDAETFERVRAKLSPGG